MNLHGKDIKIFAGNSNRELAEEIAAKIGLPLGASVVGHFSDGETAISINEVVRGSDVFILQSTSTPVNDNLMEMLILIDALKRASAGRITAVMPYFGYARQDRKAKARDPISAKLVANLITTAGADRVLTMDLHATQLQGFFDIPLDHLVGSPILAQYFYEKLHQDLDNVVVVSPDIGSVGRSRKFAEKLDCPLAIIDKRRPKANVCEIMNIIGDVRASASFWWTTSSTPAEPSSMRQCPCGYGRHEVFACCTHGVLSGPAIDRIRTSPSRSWLPSIPSSTQGEDNQQDVTLSVPCFAEAIERIYGDISISPCLRSNKAKPLSSYDGLLQKLANQRSAQSP
jgi:ribose-phosphate pyrophosphokinase